jgi:hypothetical protein
MCFSFKISIGTFIISWSISLYLLNKDLNKKQKQNVIFLMIFSSIQLADAILWFIKMKKNIINYIVTSLIIPTILSLQLLYNNFVANNILIFKILSIIVSLYMFFKFNGYSKSLCNNKFSSPIWGSKEINIIEFIIFAILILYPNWKLLIFVIFILYPLIKILVNGAFGSMWCALANFGAFFYLYKYRKI